jgi:AhpD family alkylhydroperoxidase
MSRLPMTSLSTGVSGLLEVEMFTDGSGLPANLLGLVRLRVGQINRCAPVVDKHAHELLERGEKPERVWSVAAWRDAPYYTAAERAALRLTETATRLHDNADGVPDDVWSEVCNHFDTTGQVALTLAIASMNAFSRIHIINQTPVGTNRSTAGGASCALPAEPTAT